MDETGHGSSPTTQDEFPADEQTSVVVALNLPRSGDCLSACSPRLSSTDDFGERAAELGAHRAVEDEVDRAVDDDGRVPDVAQRNVDVVEYASINAAEERQKTRRTHTERANVV